jgi:hypothetical protein
VFVVTSGNVVLWSFVGCILCVVWVVCFIVSEALKVFKHAIYSN